MSLIQMQVAIDEHRGALQSAGIRGIDLDYLLEPGVDHKPCLAALEAVVANELARVIEVKGMCTPEQWAWFELMEEKRMELKTLKRAVWNFKLAFKNRVLKFHKEAEARAIAKGIAAKVAAEKAIQNQMSENERMQAEAIEQDRGDLDVHTGGA